MELAEPGPGPALLPREPCTRPGPRRPLRTDGMRLRELSLRQDPDLRQELASLARGCDFVLPSRFKKRLKAFQQVGVPSVCLCVRGWLAGYVRANPWLSVSLVACLSAFCLSP